MLKKIVCLSFFAFISTIYILFILFLNTRQTGSDYCSQIKFGQAIAQTTDSSPTNTEEEQDFRLNQKQNVPKPDMKPDSKNSQKIRLETNQPAVTISPFPQHQKSKQSASGAASIKGRLPTTSASDAQDNFNHQLQQQLFSNIEILSKKIKQLQNRPLKLSADASDKSARQKIASQKSGFYIEHNSPSAIIALMLGGMCLLAASWFIKPLS